MILFNNLLMEFVAFDQVLRFSQFLEDDLHSFGYAAPSYYVSMYLKARFNPFKLRIQAA